MMVAPFTGAWIEITVSLIMDQIMAVAPFTGAWIEIFLPAGILLAWPSLPSRERGLK